MHSRKEIQCTHKWLIGCVNMRALVYEVGGLCPHYNKSGGGGGGALPPLPSLLLPLWCVCVCACACACVCVCVCVWRYILKALTVGKLQVEKMTQWL